MTNWTIRQGLAENLPQIIATLADWEPLDGCGGDVQAGDVGWMFRFGPDQTASSLVEIADEDGTPGAVFLKDGDGVWLFAMDPALTRDRALADAIASWADDIQGDGPLWIDGPTAPALWRQVLVHQGFEASAEPWVHLWKPLGEQGIVDIAGVSPTLTESDVSDRIAVLTAAFERSTFTVDKWHAMAAGTCFRPELDLLARDHSGNPVAALTAWMSGVGKCGLIEPMGTHPDFRRQGHGRRLLQAAFAALAREGASSVCVVTPVSNVAAVELYRSAGFIRIGTLQAMERDTARLPGGPDGDVA